MNTIAPVSEADPAALLAQFLVGYGNMVGRGPHYVVEDTAHTMNLFAVLVGRTAIARKGTAWKRILAPLSSVDQTWADYRIQSGLSSGEGLIDAVRDGDGEEDEGIDDKRLLIFQGEFSSVLQVMARQGNTLSSVVRLAWDDGHLTTMTRKANSLRATGAHISIVGHITKDELRRHLSETDSANGFANRFLWFAVQRSKLLPDGGEVPPERVRVLEDKLRPALEQARRIRRMTRDDEAKTMWRLIYARLTQGELGMLGAVTSRGAAQVTRLSCLYALLDGSSLIKAQHLAAATAVWDYAYESAKFIFGNALGDPVADGIHEALRNAPDGLSRTDISGLFGRNQSAGRIDLALNVLREYGLAQMEQVATGGRPSQWWMATEAVTPRT